MSFSDPVVAATHAAALRSIERVVEESVTPTDPAEALHRIGSLLAKGTVMVLTGAGVSTESGIPDYRSPTGTLRRGRPMTYQEFRHDGRVLRRYWARGFVGWSTMRAVQPNRTHYALVEFERAGGVSGIVTQNVDSLHQRAGTRRLITLHGDMAQVECLSCGLREDRALIDTRMQAANPGFREALEDRNHHVNPDGDVELPPEAIEDFVMIECRRCGSQKLKPDVVYFGESVPPERKRAANELLRASSALLVVGSSLAVMSGYRLLLNAVQANKPVAVINAGPGRGDAKADLVWRTQVGEAFDCLLDHCEL